MVNLVSIEVIFMTISNYGKGSDPMVRHHVGGPHCADFFFIGFWQLIIHNQDVYDYQIISPYIIAAANLLPANREKKRAKLGDG